jgi:hypothetical protein
MTFVCLGWGSLIWCQKALPVTGAWQPDGPELSVEFARESKDKRITLVLCEGLPDVRTLWAELDVAALAEAKKALAAREGIVDDNIRHSIGFWSPDARSRGSGADTVAAWAAGRNLDGVVWTALKPRIGGVQRVPDKDEVIAHLRALTGTERDNAEEYVRLAPRQILTPYRRAIEEALGWSAAGLV